MGNRAVITFDKNPKPSSIGIYLHWNGGPESVLAFLEAADKLKVRNDNDKQYELARIVQIIANFFGGTNSIGIGLLGEMDTDNGNNGLYSVERNGTIIIRQKKSEDSAWETLDISKLKKHPYWTQSPSILENVLASNKEAFKEE